jgi:deazaflavin-dependent oxidoreductase (nitroreductase family)
MTKRKRRAVTFFHRYVANPVMRPMAGRLPGHALLETTGRKSGRPRTTPVGGRLVDGSFWLVSDHGSHSQYVRNIEADPRVRVQIRGVWHEGTAHLLPDDAPLARLKKAPWHNSMLVRLFGTNLLTVRVDLDKADPGGE